MLTVSFVVRGAVPLVLGFVFLTAGISKFVRSSSVVHIVSNYRLLPHSAVRVTAYLLATLESTAGTLFVLSPWLSLYRFAWSLTTSLFLIFSVAIASALLQGLMIPCGSARCLMAMLSVG